MTVGAGVRLAVHSACEVVGLNGTLWTHIGEIIGRNAMEDIEGIVFLILGMWLFITARRQMLFQQRLKAERHKTDEKHRRVWKIINQTRSIGRRRMIRVK